ncbi:transposase [Brevibacterium sp. UCMA 11752]|uniref:transposase n=1 Tax=Brevibacterium sp. UCMA 11752 TaxID=2745946 RepID=UPI001F395175|nr:transposase [Brevibacterium sp. UCMA 11752]
MPKSPQAPNGNQESSLNAGNIDARQFVRQRSHELALLVESWEIASDAKRRTWIDLDLYQPYEAFASGEPCRECDRPLLDKPSMNDQAGTSAAINADNADFRSKHEDCHLGFWNIEKCSVEHCHRCCPPLPLSPDQRDFLRDLLGGPPTPRVTWQLKMTCGHVERSVAGSNPPSTARCSECSVTRGVEAAARDVSEEASDANASDLDKDALVNPPCQLLTDEQWKLVKPIVESDIARGRGRPRVDARTVVDAILHREHTGITWRELPVSLGSWQTAARRHRQLTADGKWEEILRALTKSNAAE